MKKQHTSPILSWAYILVNLGSVVGIAYFEDKCILFLAVLIANLLWGSIWRKKISNNALAVGRVLVGMLFIYSGFVKGVDPLGTKYRMIDYFMAFNMEWASPAALYLGILMIAAEFALGIAMLLNYRIRLSSGLISLMMLFFTFVTLNDALYSPVPDCGCFGDALIISNWQTFYKNLVIDALLLPVFLQRKHMYKPVMPKLSSALTLSTIALFVGFEFYNIANLPVMDFRGWKVGNELYPKNPEPITYYFTYENTKTGELKEFVSDQIPWQDPGFKETWTFKDSREDDPNAGKDHLFPMMDEQMNDYAMDVVSDNNYVFLMVIYDITDVSVETMQRFDAIAERAQKDGYNFVFLSSDAPDVLAQFQAKYEMGSYTRYFSDDTSLKAAVRSNPGLIIVREGVVINKYHHRTLPAYDEIMSDLN